MTSKALYNAAYIKAGEIANQVIKRHHGKTPKYKDYPATVVSCSSKGSSIHKVEHSRSCQNYKFDSRILDVLKTIGNVDGKSNIKDCDNRVGHCAEPHAANEMIKTSAKLKVADLEFGFAVRPRTKEIIPYCGNCKATFKQLV